MFVLRCHAFMCCFASTAKVSGGPQQFGDTLATLLVAGMQVMGSTYFRACSQGHLSSGANSMQLRSDVKMAST